LGAHRVSLRCDDTNLRSARVAERCGFTREGCLRETHANPQGGFSGDLLYGILRGELP
jgi:ribosomal-protein-serine acetyltransferase